MPVVLALLALFVQAMIPGASLAYEAHAAAASETVVLCTAEGAVAVAVPGKPAPHKGFAGLKCHLCVMASVAAIGADAPVARPAAQVVTLDVLRPAAQRPQAPSRAPPRPPSTAPPANSNA